MKNKYTDRKNEMIHVSMQMISYCGEADQRIHEALKRADQEDFAGIDELLKTAKEYLNQAHMAQSHIIQTSIDQDEEVTLLLFNHAQDIYMTKNTELINAEHLVNIYKKIWALKEGR
ncbi:PTS lactose/cellobiose transporter subunit IIA [Holdemania massiliensis]|uniref:PTS lactose/cellobiose transporter subunit IIA n=1 Tax=Holdemania massiliensis TaxID=1468449 RepID=UPI001F06CE51|nr:PTS lactose/cellobiose transporter subunit IIA [Holdemania massiliensis]MCH1939832.1 PTS lactose/cellobiose transporter subunit IIA [Holdemania massiliensis]